MLTGVVSLQKVAFNMSKLVKPPFYFRYEFMVPKEFSFFNPKIRSRLTKAQLRA